MTTTQDWIDHAMAGKPVISIGQIDAATKRALDRLAHKGELVKVRGYWHFLCIGTLKTIWVRPDAAVFPTGQIVKILIDKTEAAP